MILSHYKEYYCIVLRIINTFCVISMNKMFNMHKHFYFTLAMHRVIIIGSSPAAYTAALYTATANNKPLLFIPPVTYNVRNYERIVGLPDMTEEKFGCLMRAQLERFGVEIRVVDHIEVVEGVKDGNEGVDNEGIGENYENKDVCDENGNEGIGENYENKNVCDENGNEGIGENKDGRVEHGCVKDSDKEENDGEERSKEMIGKHIKQDELKEDDIDEGLLLLEQQAINESAVRITGGACNDKRNDELRINKEMLVVNGEECLALITDHDIGINAHNVFMCGGEEAIVAIGNGCMAAIKCNEYIERNWIE
ncbi:Thioredoxin reductase [Trachipleistophora hominis]|uniref:Thioredoxin reductase n=1 Tax=Trachipleistophora hominis TaxID=72359 RepID=L7JZN3_TRAHO|nr:Thioredoxin reductase [Trachipleistophora hominis]